MRTQSRRASTTLLLALVTVGLLGGVGDADEAGFIERAPGATSTVTIPEGATLATPQDVASSGGTAEEVAAQEAAWAALPANVAREQRRLIAREEARLQGWLKSRVDGEAPTLAHTAGAMTPMVGQAYCASGNYNSYYKVRQGNTIECFGGSPGIVNLNPMFTYVGLHNVDVQSASYTGRVRFTISNYWYNSKWRYPGDYTWHGTVDVNYDQIVVIRRVELA